MSLPLHWIAERVKNKKRSSQQMLFLCQGGNGMRKNGEAVVWNRHKQSFQVAVFSTNPDGDSQRSPSVESANLQQMCLQVNSGLETKKKKKKQKKQKKKNGSPWVGARSVCCTCGL
ncbi:hypothetical protein Q5P01_016440 [Channa striata]|uniref:Uncharacterized protein n=1 Tax=Channa striata TaxID=64152 RepID=A0AA88MG93_CHASR|nr:hypothetical protein Q5P01_016440 [Channa striata]